MFSQILLPVVLAAVGVHAVTSTTASICAQPTATVNSAADATALASCATISGSILIGPAAAGVISIDGPQQVLGDFICENAGALTSLGSTTIGTIGGSFTLTNLTLLSTLAMNDLTTVNEISWSALPALSALTFPSVISTATSVTITNTFLSSLDGMNFNTIATLNINNNNRLKTFSTQVANVTSLLQIDSNGESLDVAFPNLIWAANATFRNVSTLSIPSLAYVNGSLGFYGCNFDSLAAPNLTAVGTKTAGTDGGGIALVGNSALANISMPLLSAVAGAAQIANNSALGGISYPALSTVGGAIDFSGNFSTLLLPALSLVSGGFNVQTTASIDCSPFQAEKGKVILGVYTCITTADAKSGVGSATTTGSTSSATSKAAATSYGINEAVAGLSVVGGLLQMLL